MAEVRILTGRAGTLLPVILPEITAELKAGRRIMLLVPEQYTLQAERELIRFSGLPGLIGSEVLSPKRLMTLVREKGGHDPRTPLNRRGRAMALARALVREKDALSFYGGVVNRTGLPDKLASVIMEMENGGTLPEDLAQCLRDLPEDGTRMKLADICRLWTTSKALTDTRFADETVQHADFLTHLRASGVLEGCRVWVYGFDAFSAVQCERLAAIAALAAGMTVTMTAEEGKVLFAIQNAGLKKLRAALTAAGLRFSLCPVPAADSRRTPALTVLEKGLFDWNADTFTDRQDSVRVLKCTTPNEEAMQTARQLRSWHDRDGIPYEAMAVMTASGSTETLSMALTAAAVPHYVAVKESMGRHGLCRMLTGALRSVSGWRREDVLMVIRSGFSGLSAGEAAQLENYVTANGITGSKKWLQPFTRGNAEACEPLRQKIIMPLAALHSALKAARKGESSLIAVYQYLTDTEAYEQLKQREKELLDRDLLEEAARNRQIWREMMGLLDQLHALLATERVSMKDLCRYLEAGLSEAVTTGVPPTAGQVSVGQVGNLMAAGIRAAVINGMQDGILTDTTESLLTDDELALISEKTSKDAGMRSDLRHLLKQTGLYKAIALPEEKLLLTCALSKQDGGVLLHSGLLDRVETLLGGVTLAAPRNDLLLPPVSPEDALDRLPALIHAHGIAGLSAVWQEALRYLYYTPRWRERTEAMLNGFTFALGGEKLTREQAASLFNHRETSVTRLESFSGCPFRHFLECGLCPVEAEEFKFEGDKIGSFYHNALNRFTEAAIRHDSWPNLTEPELDSLTDAALETATADWADSPLTEDAIGETEGSLYRDAFRTTARAVMHQLMQQDFRIAGTEVVFGEAGSSLPPLVLDPGDGQPAALRGRIDRLDTFEGAGGTFVTITDYKKSETVLSPGKVQAGLQLQLLLYWKAVLDGMKGAHPACAVYQQVTDPATEVTDVTENAAAREKGMRVRGIYSRNPEVLEAFDRDNSGLVCHHGKLRTKDLEPVSKDVLLREDQLNALMDAARQKAESLLVQLRSGDIAIRPTGEKGEHGTNPCRFCHPEICGHDDHVRGGGLREIDTKCSFTDLVGE